MFCYMATETMLPTMEATCLIVKEIIKSSYHIPHKASGLSALAWGKVINIDSK